MKNAVTILRTLVLCLILLAPVLAAFAPQPALAAGCVETYIVRKGDTTMSIAQSYGIKWGVIAAENRMKPDYKLEAGMELCIPEKRTAASRAAASRGKIVVTVIHNRVYVKASDFRNDGIYYVRVRDGEVKSGGWERIGRMKIEARQLEFGYFPLPVKLKNAETITLCLKNATTDAVICQTVEHLT